LAEVGKLETPKLQGKYEAGQLILHRVFGYRGVILFPWLARVYDRDISNKKDEYVQIFNNCMDKYLLVFFIYILYIDNLCIYLYRKNNNSNNDDKEVKGRTHTFYQVLIDQRDCPYIVSKIKKFLMINFCM